MADHELKPTAAEERAAIAERISDYALAPGIDAGTRQILRVAERIARGERA